MTLRRRTFENLSKQNLVFCSGPTVFTPDFPGASLVGGRCKVYWGVHREDCGGEGGTVVGRKGGWVKYGSSGNENLKPYVLIFHIGGLRSITETEPRSIHL